MTEKLRVTITRYVTVSNDDNRVYITEFMQWTVLYYLQCIYDIKLKKKWLKIKQYHKKKNLLDLNCQTNQHLVQCNKVLNFSSVHGVTLHKTEKVTKTYTTSQKKVNDLNTRKNQPSWTRTTIKVLTNFIPNSGQNLIMTSKFLPILCGRSVADKMNSAKIWVSLTPNGNWIVFHTVWNTTETSTSQWVTLSFAKTKV